MREKLRTLQNMVRHNLKMGWKPTYLDFEELYTVLLKMEERITKLEETKLGENDNG